jgi:3'(2'), 5'-bisphosphate nucleotidase
VPLLNATACAELLQSLTALTVSAALAILKIGAGNDVRTKADGSPVTAADEIADALIRNGLKRLAPMPIVSEEHADTERPDFAGASVLLVDPLDGTRDFVAGRDEYTVNIAVVSDRVPLLGVIAAPALGLVWRGIAGRGAERMAFSADGRTSPPQAIRARQPATDALTVLASRSHLDPHTRAYVDALPRAHLLQSGSSAKFCRIAEGAADVYPRLAPTHDWDIAAGHAILTAAGGSMTTPDGAALAYGTKDLLVPAFLAWGDPARAVLLKD